MRSPSALCGTDSGYYRHTRTGPRVGPAEPACGACLEAHRVAEARRTGRSERPPPPRAEPPKERGAATRRRAAASRRIVWKRSGLIWKAAADAS